MEAVGDRAYRPGGMGSGGWRDCVDPDDLNAFLAARLDPVAVRALEQHVAGCSACRELLSTLARAQPEITGALGPQDADSMSPTQPQAPGLDAELSPGTSVGRYVVLRRLGAGAMGVVYAAHDPGLIRKVALKIIRGDAFRPAAQERLEREAQAMARLAHPNVVTVFDVDRFAGRLFIAMELVEGPTLAAWLRQAPRTWREILATLLPAGEGLAAAHAAGLVHRDFKPENVLVGDDGRIRVGDFGLACASPGGDETAGGSPLSASESGLPGSLAGTPFFMAPEQLHGEADARADQFSFCVALYAALVGAHPYEGVPLETLASPAARAAVPAPPRGDALPRWLWRVLVRGLSLDPRERFPSMVELLRALGRDPRRQLVRGVLVALPLAAVVLGSALTTRSTDPTPPVCTGGEEQWDGVWDADRSQAVSRAFTATGKPYAPAAFALVRRNLDAQAQSWAHAYRDACEATRVRGVQSEDILDKRMSCLAARLGEARALTDTFVRGGADVVEKASLALQALGDLRDCEAGPALAEQASLPADPLLRARVTVVRARLAAMKYEALYDKRGSRDARALTSLVDEARATRYRPVEAQALFDLSRQQRASGQLKQAAATLEQGIWAAEAGRMDRLAARSWVNLMTVRGDADGKYEEALAHTPRVTALIERLGGDLEIEGLLRSARASLLQSAGKVTEARTEALLAVRAFEGLEDRSGTYLPLALGTLANVHFALGAFGEARAIWERELAIKRIVLGEHHPEVAMLEQHIGTALSVDARQEEASVRLERAERILTEAVDEHHPARAIVAHNLGLVYENLERYEDALAAHRRSSRIAKVVWGEEHPSYAIMLMSQANPLAALGHQREAVALLEQVLASLERKLGPDHPRVSYAVAHLGDLAYKAGRYAEARTYMRRAIAIQEKALGPRPPDLRSFLLILGQIELAAGRPEQAIAPLERARSFGADQGNRDEHARVELALGQALAGSRRDPARGRALVESARDHFASDPRMTQDHAEATRFLAGRR
jgi:tetratricopeptide (TPR) repeat protein/predicted Ser/Thr protein kinase